MYSEEGSNMIVKWTEFDSLGYQYACDHYPEANPNPKDYEKEFQGEVLDKYKPILGAPKFVVALPDGDIVTVRMDRCKIVQK